MVRIHFKRNISYNMKLDGYDRANILSGMRRLERVVSLDPNGASFCIRFRPKTDSDKYFISIINGNGCSSFVNINKKKY
jgi:hypothetical protein